MYYEDTDLSWRLRERGWRVLYVREAVARHDHASSSGTGSPMFIQVNVPQPDPDGGRSQSGPGGDAGTGPYAGAYPARTAARPGAEGD